MTKFVDNDATLLAIDETYAIDYKAENVFDRGANYLVELANKNFFLEAITNYINNGTTDFNGNIQSLDDIRNYIKNAYDKAGVRGDKKKGEFSYNPSLLKKWVNGAVLPSQKETLRISLCLGMSVSEAAEFIFKSSLCKPFNFKDIYDSVAYFCLNNGKSFADSQRIISEIENADVKCEEYPENDTLIIGERVKTFSSETELIQYLATNKAGFTVQNQTAFATLNDLVKTSVELAEWDRKENYTDTHISAIESGKDIPAILNVILGYEARAKINGVEVYKKKIDKSNFPGLVSSAFPQPQQLQDYLNQKSSSTEGIRKAIILFAFYNLFTKFKKDGKKIQGFDVYADTIDEILAKSGYIQMYWKHPYDWMFGYCAGAEDPVEELRDLIRAFYLDLEEIYSEENQFDKK